MYGGSLPQHQRPLSAYSAVAMPTATTEKPSRMTGFAPSSARSTSSAVTTSTANTAPKSKDPYANPVCAEDIKVWIHGSEI